MTEQREKSTRRRVRFHENPPPELGRVILEREIPSEIALVTPLIIRVTDFLLTGSVIPMDFKNKLQLCLDEALRNAVLHGNKREFSKKVKLKAFVGELHWGILIEDEGDGFSREILPTESLNEDSVWGESGRGIHLMEHYMDEVDYYCGGRVLVMAKFL